MCYYYDGDGVCEDFERETGVRDCGLYTPSGFLDQWASHVDVSHEEKPYCSGDVAAGYPAVTKVSSYRKMRKIKFFINVTLPQCNEHSQQHTSGQGNAS